jgi:hypothetical protein
MYMQLSSTTVSVTWLYVIVTLLPLNDVRNKDNLLLEESLAM